MQLQIRLIRRVTFAYRNACCVLALHVMVYSTRSCSEYVATLARRLERRDATRRLVGKLTGRADSLTEAHTCNWTKGSEKPSGLLARRCCPLMTSTCSSPTPSSQCCTTTPSAGRSHLESVCRVRSRGGRGFGSGLWGLEEEKHPFCGPAPWSLNAGMRSPFSRESSPLIYPWIRIAC